MFGVSDAGLLLPNKGSKGIRDVFTDEEWRKIRYYWTIKKEEYSPPRNLIFPTVANCRIFLRPIHLNNGYDSINFYYAPNNTTTLIKYTSNNLRGVLYGQSYSWSGGDICIEQKQYSYFYFYENQNLIASDHYGPNGYRDLIIFDKVSNIYSHILIISSPSNDFNTDYQIFQKFVKEV